MDHNENEELLQPQEEPVCQPERQQPQVQQPETEQPQDGYYHGAGAGQRESVYGATPYTVHQYPPQQPRQPWNNVYQQPAAQTAASAKPKRKGAFWKGLLAAVLVVALIVVSAGVSAFCVDRVWQQQYQLLQKNFDEKLDILRKQIGDGVTSGNPGGELVTGESLSATQIYQQNVRSVVAITASVRTSANGGIYESSSAGTGFVWTENGYIITNHHVIEGASAVTVTMHNGQAFEAAVIGADATNDIALLKIQVAGLDPVTIGSSASTQVGDQVVAIGNALGELTSSLTVGYVSGIDRDVDTDGNIMTMIQTDAAINAGNSGGPLFNARGEVIGINTAKYSGTTNSGASIEGIGFAIPIDDVIGMLDDLMNYGYIRSAYLGIECYAVPESATIYGVPQGVYVQRAVPGFCAATAGIRAGDIIIGLGGFEVQTLNDLSKALRAYSAGDTITVTVWRSGRQVIMNVTLDEKPRS